MVDLFVASPIPHGTDPAAARILAWLMSRPPTASARCWEPPIRAARSRGGPARRRARRRRHVCADLPAAAANGLTPSLSALTRRVAGTTLDQLDPVAASLLRPEAQGIVLRGSDAAVRAALTAAGLSAPGTASRRP